MTARENIINFPVWKCKSLGEGLWACRCRRFQNECWVTQALGTGPGRGLVGRDFDLILIKELGYKHGEGRLQVEMEQPMSGRGLLPQLLTLWPGWMWGVFTRWNASPCGLIKKNPTQRQERSTTNLPTLQVLKEMLRTWRWCSGSLTMTLIVIKQRSAWKGCSLTPPSKQHSSNVNMPADHPGLVKFRADLAGSRR